MVRKYHKAICHCLRYAYANICLWKAIEKYALYTNSLYAIQYSISLLVSWCSDIHWKSVQQRLLWHTNHFDGEEDLHMFADTIL